MKQQDYFAAFEKENQEELELTKRKNSDYADDANAFANFEIIHHLSCGRITPEQGFVVRMSDKMQRIANLIARENQVPDEKITDTLRDLSVYSKLLRIYLMNKGK